MNSTLGSVVPLAMFRTEFGVHKCSENGILKRPWEVLLLECGQQQTVSLSVRYLWKESERSKNSCVQMAGVVRSVEYPPIAQSGRRKAESFPKAKAKSQQRAEQLKIWPSPSEEKGMAHYVRNHSLTHVEYKGSTDGGRGGGMNFWGWRSEGQPNQGIPRFLQKWCVFWRSLVMAVQFIYTAINQNPLYLGSCNLRKRLVQIIISALVR